MLHTIQKHTANINDPDIIGFAIIFALYGQGIFLYFKLNTGCPVTINILSVFYVYSTGRKFQFSQGIMNLVPAGMLHLWSKLTSRRQSAPQKKRHNSPREPNLLILH